MSLPPSIVLGDARPDLLLDETLSDIFNTSAGKYATSTALVFKNKTLTYQQVNEWSDAVAFFLKEKGIGRGHFVGVWWPRGLELHIAILGIAKAGAAYVPMDREMPAERVITVLKEAGAAACFCNGELDVNCQLLAVPGQPVANSTPPFPATPLPDDVAYVLYTSGSTGTPKGISITHRNICHFVRAEQCVLGIVHEDRVYQGFSVSFDMWCEETWISYLVGASLYVADEITSKSFDEFDKILVRDKITVLHAVPSLLAVVNDDVPLLRLINAGGEACTPQVRDKWAKPGRLFFNSYGPTETTVTATIKQLSQNEPINIGKPLPNYNAAIIDENYLPVPIGEKGELVITGPGVGNGYINSPDLTAQKFLPKPVTLESMPGEWVYRTGDAAIMQPNGSIDFQGRMDDQVKLRGYRVELGEIENVLHDEDGVVTAAVTIKKDSRDNDALVGYVVLKQGQVFHEAALKEALGKKLPTYMVPNTIMQLATMPRLASGKIDRKALPVPPVLLEYYEPADETPIDAKLPLAERVLIILHKVFPNREIKLAEDFFTDIGGHSLLAAIVISRLRTEGGIPEASIKDIYTHRPLLALVNYWEGEEGVTGEKKTAFNKVPKYRFYTCMAAQTIALFFIYGAYAIQIFFPYLGYYYVQQDTDNHIYALLMALVFYSMVPLFFTILSIAAKWVFIGKMREGDYPLWGTYYFRWWLVKSIQRLTIMQFMNGTPLYNRYLKYLGVKVANDAQLSSFTIGAEDLVSIGKNVTISSQVVLNNAHVEDGLLKLRRIEIKDNAYIGSSAVVSGNTVIGEWGELKDLSHLPEGKEIPNREVWLGSPAKYAHGQAPEICKEPVSVSAVKYSRFKAYYGLLLFVFPFTVLLPLLPTIIVLNELDNAAAPYDFSYLVITPVLSFAYIVLFSAITIVLVRFLQAGIKPGRHSIYSRFYIKKWLADQLLALSLIVLHPIYATIYVSRLFRALGAKIGKDTEISTASNVTHPLLEIGEGSFIADAVTLGEVDVRSQELILEKTVIGNRSFVGNSALIPQGYKLPDNMLVGVLSTPPDAEQLRTNDAKDYLGSPAIALPKRQESQKFSNELTMYPSLLRKISRGTVELVRILLPESVLLVCSVLFIAYTHDLIKGGVTHEILYIPGYYLFFIGIPCFLITVALKWIFAGRYTPLQQPMWTWKVWRSEAITTTYEALAVPFFLEYLKGTPWLPLALRLLGVKTGKRVWMFTTDITEFDMVKIGDDVAMNEDSGPQTHLFEDRVMKVGKIVIGDRSSIGARSIILYDSEVGADVNLDPLSLVMKGEKLADNTVWTGSPVSKK